MQEGEDHLGIYPRLVTQARVHLHPGGGRVYVALPSAELEVPDVEVNEWGTSCLLMMDGTRSLLDLCELATENEALGMFGGDSEEAVCALVELINGLAGRDYMELLPGPQLSPVTVSGSREKFTPIHASIELTDHCNLSCRHCYRESGPARRQFISSTDLNRWLAELRNSGVGVVELTGGEPTSHPEFVDILGRCAELFSLTAIISNGTLWTPAMEEIVANNAERFIVQIDMDGATAESHDYLRGPGAFVKATAALRRLSERGVRCRAAMSVHAKNVDEIVETAALVKSLGARWFSFSPVLAMGRGRFLESVPKEKGYIILEAIKKIDTMFPRFLFYGKETELDISRPGSNCGAGWKGIVIGPDGRVRACVMHDAKYLEFGTLGETGVRGIVETMPTDRFKAIPAPNLEDCADCKHVEFCAGCPARAVQAIERHRGKGDGFTCRWAEKYDALEVYAPGLC